MKKATFKKPFNGMDNALKLIPESYKVDGNEFEVSDGIETYRVRWDGSLTEGKGAVLTANNQNMINEDMNKIKHLMNFNSKETLGNLKGSERIDENKSFQDVWGKTKKILSESKEDRDTINEMDGGYGFTSENNFGDNEMPEVEVTEMDMPGSSNLVGEMENVVDEGKELPCDYDMEITEPTTVKEEEGSKDVNNVKAILANNSVVMAAMKKINTREEKIELAKGLVKALGGGDASLTSKIAREILDDVNTADDIEAAEKGDEQKAIAKGEVTQFSNANESIEEECNECDEKLEEMDTFDKIFEGMYEDVDEGVKPEKRPLVKQEENPEIPKPKKPLVKQEKNVDEGLSPEQSDEMDTDKDGDIDAKDLENLRDDK